MRLSTKIVINYASINSFDYGNQWTIRANEPNTLYFQLVDLDRASLRYIPIGSTPGVVVKFPSIDDSAELAITATAVSAADGSLWKLDLTSLQVPSSGNVVFEFTEGGVTRRFSLLSGIAVEYPGNDGSC